MITNPYSEVFKRHTTQVVDHYVNVRVFCDQLGSILQDLLLTVPRYFSGQKEFLGVEPARFGQGGFHLDCVTSIYQAMIAITVWAIAAIPVISLDNSLDGVQVAVKPIYEGVQGHANLLCKSYSQQGFK